MHLGPAALPADGSAGLAVQAADGCWHVARSRFSRLRSAGFGLGRGIGGDKMLSACRPGYMPRYPHLAGPEPESCYQQPDVCICLDMGGQHLPLVYLRPPQLPRRHTSWYCQLAASRPCLQLAFSTPLLSLSAAAADSLHFARLLQGSFCSPVPQQPPACTWCCMRKPAIVSLVLTQLCTGQLLHRRLHSDLLLDVRLRC